MSMLWVLVVLALLPWCHATAQSPGVQWPVCPEVSEVWLPASRQCVSCPSNATAVGGECRCADGFAWVREADATVAMCVDCAAHQKVVSSANALNQSQYCIGCGGDVQLSCLVDAVYDAVSQRCVCPSGSVLTERVGSLALTAQMCVPCGAGGCVACTPPYVVDPSGGCSCGSGYVTLEDGSCASEAAFNEMTAAAQGSTASLTALNIDNKGSSGGSVTSLVAQRDSVITAVACKEGNTTACNYLANLCVLMLYNPRATPCALYLYLQRSDGCLDEQCEQPASLPWLYYTRSSVDVMSSVLFLPTAQQPLELVVSTYHLNGTWLGYQNLLQQWNLCRLPNTAAERFYVLGDSRVTSCRLNWEWLLTAGPSPFYELFLVHPNNRSELVPIPVLLDYSNDARAPKNIYDPWLLTPAGSPSATSTASGRGLRRRFSLYDTVSYVTAADGTPAYLTTLWAVSLFHSSAVNAREGILTPIAVLQYASKETSELRLTLAAGSGIVDPVTAVNEQPLNSTASAQTVEQLVRAAYLPNGDPVSQGLMITAVVMCGVCLLSAWVRTYGWMRRRQNVVLDAPALARFFVFYCDHISTMFFVVVVVTTWYLLISYKSQHYLITAVRESEPYVEAMLYVVVVCKGVAVLYRLVEQCNADYFVIDWERSKGQLLRESKIVPVSMWRSTFLANELNELQVLRYWHPLLTMVLVALFLVGLRYESLTTSVIGAVRQTDPSALTFDSLRIGVDTFFWIAVTLVTYLLQFQVFYRFVVVHPLQAFVDLCSVANISVIVLLESHWGFYIHGESIHAHADVSMEEFQHNLSLEAEGNLPVRGLGGQSKCQTFEVFLGTYTRQYLYMCYNEMQLESQKALGKARAAPPPNPAQWHYINFAVGASRKAKEFSAAALAIKDRINHAFRQSVRRAEGTLLVKFTLQGMLDIPPNLVYLNGPQSGDKAGKDLFFFDDVLSYGRAFMCGMDLDLFILYTALFAAIDASLNNLYAALVLTYAVELVFRWYRGAEGEVNMAEKTLIDSRFFL